MSSVSDVFHNPFLGIGLSSAFYSQVMPLEDLTPPPAQGGTCETREQAA